MSTILMCPKELSFQKNSDLIDKVVMSEEGSQLLSHTLKSLDIKLNSLVVGNCGRKRKESEERGRSAQREVIKDPIQVKRNEVTKTSQKEKQSQY